MKYNFDKKDNLSLELKHYALIRKHYKVPILLKVGDNFLEYQTINVPIVYRALDKNEHTSLLDIYKIMRDITPVRCAPEGGTKLFYLDRAGRLDALPSLPTHEVTINRSGVTTTETQKMKERLLTALECLDNGFCIPSNGDFLERNIFIDGTIIDFEGVGYNSVIADAATFLFHTIFAGTYFGPKYGKWASLLTRMNTTPKKDLAYACNGPVSREKWTRFTL